MKSKEKARLARNRRESKKSGQPQKRSEKQWEARLAQKNRSEKARKAGAMTEQQWEARNSKKNRGGHREARKAREAVRSKSKNYSSSSTKRSPKNCPQQYNSIHGYTWWFEYNGRKHESLQKRQLRTQHGHCNLHDLRDAWCKLIDDCIRIFKCLDWESGMQYLRKMALVHPCTT